MDKVRFDREKAREANRNDIFWYPSEEVEAIFEVLAEPREGRKVGKMKKDPWLLDVKVIHGRDKDDKNELVMDNAQRALVLNSKTVIESRFKDLLSRYKELEGKRFVIIGLGEVEGENGTYVDYYIDAEDKARRDKVIE